MRLFLKYAGIRLKGAMQYKVSFFLTPLAQAVTASTALLGVWFMLRAVPEVAGFGFHEALLCFGVINMAFSLAETIGRGFDLFPRLIGNGVFDRIMVRPRSPVFQALAQGMDFSRMGRLMQALPVLLWALPQSGIRWTMDKVLTLLLMLSCGSVLFFCLFLIYAALSFFTLEGLEFINIFTDGGREFGRYPFSIYGKEVLRIFTFVVPLALVQYWPLLYLTGRESGALYMLSPLFSLLFILPSYGLWRFGLRRYKSTGS